MLLPQEENGHRCEYIRSMLVIDRGYQDFAWWLDLSRHKVFFVTRLKDNAEYGVIEQRPCDRDRGILRDEVVLLTRSKTQVRWLGCGASKCGSKINRNPWCFSPNHLKRAAAT